MSETAPHAAPPLATLLLAAAKRLGTSVLPFVVVILIWQFASLFFPRFLFPSLIDVFWRCSRYSSMGHVCGTCWRRSFGFWRGCWSSIVGGLLAC